MLIFVSIKFLILLPWLVLSMPNNIMSQNTGLDVAQVGESFNFKNADDLNRFIARLGEEQNSFGNFNDVEMGMDWFVETYEFEIIEEEYLVIPDYKMSQNNGLSQSGNCLGSNYDIYQNNDFATADQGVNYEFESVLEIW